MKDGFSGVMVCLFNEHEMRCDEIRNKDEFDDFVISIRNNIDPWSYRGASPKTDAPQPI